jgi:hypothetical protein
VTPPGLRYDIDVTLDPGRHRLDGRATIVYRSGADTALTRLYLHTYPNAFSGPHTIYARDAERQGENYDLRFAKPGELGWMSLDSASVNGTPATISIDETIATVLLPRPLAPGDSARLTLRFAVQVPRHFDRLGRTGEDYSLSQWYPKMVVYDDLGWHPDPFHYLAEFYGDYGTFDVTMHVPDDYWVGSTGVLTHVAAGDNEIPLQDRDTARDSVTVTLRAAAGSTLTGTWPSRGLRVETDLFTDESPVHVTVPREGGARVRVPRGAPVHYRYVWDDREERDEADPLGRARPIHLIHATRDTSIVDTLRALAGVAADKDTLLPSMKTLRFRAERVHDFAWVASPDYVRADTTWSGIAIRALSLRDDQSQWVDQKRFVVDAMRHHTETVGPYVWPQFTSAEAWCGGGAMEYPMLIMNEPDLAVTVSHDLDDTIAHELGHNWFYGMLGSDERAHAWLDEGFSQWIEDDYTDHKYPRGIFKLANRFSWLAPSGGFVDDELRYLARAWARDERPMSTPAEQFASYRDYDVASYSKAVCMLRTLRGMIGEQAFARFLHHYYTENLFGHPRPEDVIRAAEGAAGRELDEFFQQWTTTTGRAGFALGKTHTRRDESIWRSTVEVRRTEQMTPTVRVEARFADGTRQTVRVSGDDDVNVARFESKAKLTGARLDPNHDLVEMYRLDNTNGFLPPMRWRPIFDFPQTDEISVLYGPTVWHGQHEGMRLGGWLEGRYLPSPDFPRGILGFEGGLSTGTETGATAWRAGAWRRAEPLGARGQIRLFGAEDEGLLRTEARIGNWATAPGRLHPWRTWWIGGQYRDRTRLDPVDHRYWSLGRTINLSAGVRIETVGPRRARSLELEYRHGAAAFREEGDPAPDANYDWARFTAMQGNELRSLGLHLHLRGLLASAWRRVPQEQLFDVAEGSRLDALVRFYENDRGPLRAMGHYLAEGGGGARGYAGRLGLGQRIAALNLELAQTRTGIFTFADVARAEASGLGESDRPTDNPLLGQTLADWGLGVAYGPVRLTAPFWLGRPEIGEAPWKVRWLVSLDLAGIHPWW